jgi:flavin reductase (DIM6/NTAB) family NADH-FMN oxidoreductase RutF
MDEKQAMEVLGRAAYGCYLLTVAAKDAINGMPLSLFMQAGFSPPMVACGVAPRRRTHAMIREAGAFAVIFLRKDQKHLVDRFKRRGDEPERKFEGMEWKKGLTGAPLIEDCLGYLECRLADELNPGDHTLFIGEVVNAGLIKDGELLTIQDLGKHYGG